jgi:VacB/RNase II family 3'-5' exoribonuclease
MSGRRYDLKAIARRAMLERDFEPDYPPEAMHEADALRGPGEADGDPKVRDLTDLPWASIDNDDSRDLDQLTVADPQKNGSTRVLVAVADVDVLVSRGSAIDEHAHHNTTSIYTAGQTFHMLPERLSTDLTSLVEGEDRLAMVVEMFVDEDGGVSPGEIFRARVHNHAKLAYPSVSAWLTGDGPMPGRMAQVKAIPEQIRIQDEAARRLRRRRAERGALDLQTIEARPVFTDGDLVDLREEGKNRAKDLIEDFMIAANGVTAAFLDKRGYASLRRVVRTPKRWPRIVDIARDLGERLPEEPDARALSDFLEGRRQADPDTFPDLSLSVVKLLGSGEYALDLPGQDPPGHFGLAVRDYAHSTAPNRRYPDLVLQRLLKAAVGRARSPYSTDELEALARHCTRKEDDAQKVERRVGKSAAALLLVRKVGQQFEGIVTGASDKGTWVRIFHPPVEGRVVKGEEGLDVGERTRVRLASVDVERGYIDFAR